MEARNWKIGELAKEAGLTVRTLHHYDQIGLFSPSAHTESGHRLYTDTDVARLHQIVSLKQLGLPLEDIKQMLEQSDYMPEHVLQLQLDRLNEQIANTVKLRDEVQELLELVRTGHVVSSDRFLMMMQVMKLQHSAYVSPEQAAQMRRRMETYTASELEQAYREGERLIAAFRDAMHNGQQPQHPDVAALGMRWKQQLAWGGIMEEAVVKVAERYYAQHPQEAMQYGLDGELYAYIRAAIAASESV